MPAAASTPTCSRLQEVYRPDGSTSVADDVARELGYDIHHSWSGRGVVVPKGRLVGRTGAKVGTGDFGQALLTRVPRGPVVEHRLKGFISDNLDRVVMTTEIELDNGTLIVGASTFRISSTSRLCCGGACAASSRSCTNRPC